MISKKILSGLVLLAVLLVGAQTVLGQASSSSKFKLEVSPVIIDELIKPGGVYTETVKIYNGTAQSVILYPRIVDFIYDENDNLLFLDDLESEDAEGVDYSRFSLKSWLSVIDQVEVDSGERVQVPVKIEVPSNVLPGGRYAAVMFTESPPKVDLKVEKGAGVGLAGETGVMMAMTVAGDSLEGGKFLSKVKPGRLGSDKEFRSKFFFFDSGPVDFQNKFVNFGNRHLKPALNFVVSNAVTGKTLNSFSAEERRVFPGSNKMLYSKVDNLPLGLFKVFLDADDSLGNKFQSKAYFMVLPPVWVLVLIAIFLILVWLYLRWQRARIEARLRAELAQKPVRKTKK